MHVLVKYFYFTVDLRWKKGEICFVLSSETLDLLSFYFFTFLLFYS